MSRQTSPWRIRTGSSMSMDVKPGRSQVRPKTSAAKPTIMRGNPRIARKPKRRSSLSSQFISAHGKGGRCACNRISGRLRSIAPTYARLSLVTEAAQKKTPLYDEHVKRGAKMVPFAGWLMPVQYTGIVEEHQAVRNNVGIFDISHMGQFVISGSCAATWLNTMLTNSIEKLDVGQGQYTF